MVSIEKGRVGRTGCGRCFGDTERGQDGAAQLLFSLLNVLQRKLIGFILIKFNDYMLLLFDYITYLSLLKEIKLLTVFIMIFFYFVN